MIDYTDTKLLRELKVEYDETLKRGYLRKGDGSWNNDFPYSPNYPLYFKKFILRNLIKSMRRSVYLAYKEGAGHELDEGPNGIPPKFLSIGSSSQFCFVSLNVDDGINEKQGADFFSHEGERIKRTYFEKQLPVFDDDNSIPPHMDAYAKTRKREYFFECKCHEMFDEHSLKLSKRYFNTGRDLIVDHIPAEYLTEEGGVVVVNPEAFGLKETVFDIKQLLTHLMGIECNRTRKHCDLIYFYSFPEEIDIEDSRISEIIQKVKEDAVAIFESKIIKEYCLAHNITLRLYYFDGHCSYAASESHVKKVY